MSCANQGSVNIMILRESQEQMAWWEGGDALFLRTARGEKGKEKTPNRRRTGSQREKEGKEAPSSFEMLAIDDEPSSFVPCEVLLVVPLPILIR